MPCTTRSLIIQSSMVSTWGDGTVRMQRPPGFNSRERAAASGGCWSGRDVLQDGQDRDRVEAAGSSGASAGKDPGMSR